MKYFTLALFIFLISCQNDQSEELALLKAQLKKYQTKNIDSNIGFVHSVFFWLEEDMSSEERDDFIVNGMRELQNCTHLTSVYFGPPANTPREVVDNSYDYAWICIFKDKEAHDAYQIDPIHLSFIEKYGKYFKEVKVYDNLVMP